MSRSWLRDALAVSSERVAEWPAWKRNLEVTMSRKTKVLTKSDVQQLVAEAIERAGSLRALATVWICSPQYLCDVRKGRRDPGPLILHNLNLVQVYVPKPEPLYQVNE